MEWWTVLRGTLIGREWNSGRKDLLYATTHLPWSDDVPDSCRLTKARIDEEAALPDEPIVGAEVLEALPDNF